MKVVQMFDDMMKSIDIENEREIEEYLVKLLDGEAFDRSGLIYGMGHAVYSLSDPRAGYPDEMRERSFCGKRVRAGIRPL